MKDKIKEILVDVYGIDGRHEDEATERILCLFNVVLQSEQLVCLCCSGSGLLPIKDIKVCGRCDGTGLEN